VDVAKHQKRSSLSPLAVNLKRILEERGISARAAAELAQIPPSTLSQWLAGINPTDMKAVNRLAVALNIEFHFLVLGEPAPSKQHKMEDHFEIENEASMSGLFEISIRRLKPKGDKS
jgi:transcriptional regulator with XRE-family HTH domain